MSKTGATRPQIDLLPWDPESPEHVERLFQQRIACGWNKDMVEVWRDQQREGKIALHWVVLSPTDPTTPSKLNTHTTAWPAESTSILDSCTNFGGKPRVANHERSFIPVGHISLDSKNENPEEADPSRGIYRISSFYITTALQSAGLGGAAMDAIERLASDEPLNAKILTLGTYAKDYPGKNEMWEALKADGKFPPKFENQDWYARRGYQISGFTEKMWTETDSTGKVWWVGQIRMRKAIK